MIPLEYELSRINEIIFEMFDLVKTQIAETKETILTMNSELAESVVRRELRVNALEITIDRECENLLACYNPVAADLRYVISAVKISESLERIGDHAYRIAKYVQGGDVKKDSPLIKDLAISQLFDVVDSMLGNAINALENKDTIEAKKVFKQDKIINRAKKDAPDIIKKVVKKDSESLHTAIHLFSIIGKLERCGDLIKNISEEIVFYIEAEILKHNKRNKKIRKRFEKEELREEKKGEE